MRRIGLGIIEERRQEVLDGYAVVQKFNYEKDEKKFDGRDLLTVMSKLSVPFELRMLCLCFIVNDS